MKKCKHKNSDHLMPGDRHGRLTIIGKGSKRGNRWLVEVRCDCGTVKDVAPHGLTSGATKSCGCLRREVGDRTRTHGMKNTPTYKSWCAMRSRCSNPNNADWKDYGGRGIAVCDRWRSFENFLADMGARPDGTSIDRRDTNGNYELSNCRWATEETQQRNRRNNKMTEESVASLRGDAASGLSSRLLGLKYGIAQTTAADIVRGESWAISKMRAAIGDHDR